jgi:uncharacterized caspase-like protein/energy-coupling factor transporter ATP-binding protein EcfA2
MARRYALVIGIQDYQSIAPLTKTRGDARSMADFLRQTDEFQDVFAVRPDATKADLVAALKQFQERARDNDALVYFTGHGFGLVDEMTDGVMGYLAAADTKVSTSGDQVIAQQNGIALSSLGTLLEQGNFSSLVLLLDACHSGLLLERGEIEQGLSGFTRKRDYFLITACRGFEQAAAIAEQPHSLFTGAVLRGLGQENADEQGKVSADRLFDVVARTLRDSGQEPLRMGMGSGITMVQYRPSEPVVQTIDETNPYQGLQAFTKETKRFFFGRDRVVDDLVLKLQESNFVPLIGPSGSGKSSVVRAGLIPRLEDLGWHVLEPMKPGVEPIYELKRSLDPIFDRRQLASIHQRLDEKGLQGILDLLPDRKHLLVVDQFEEVFTLSGDRAKQRRFIEMLVGLEVGDRLSVVTTMRSDFVEFWQAHGDLVGVLQGLTVWMPPWERSDLRDAIVKPARVQGYEFGDGLEALILEHVSAEPKALPLLEFALEKLWDYREQNKHRLTVAAYEEMGGFTGALNRYATDWYETLTESDQMLVRRVMLGLVRMGVESKDTRWRRKLADILAIGDVADVINLLVEKRLLVQENDEIDLAHERLMDGWGLFSEWRGSDRDARLLAQRIKDAMTEWQNQRKKKEYLIQGGLLLEIQRNYSTIKIFLTKEEIFFYHASQTHDRGRLDAIESTVGKISDLAKQFKVSSNTSQDERSFRDFFKELEKISSTSKEIISSSNRNLASIQHIAKTLSPRTSSIKLIQDLVLKLKRLPIIANDRTVKQSIDSLEKEISKGLTNERSLQQLAEQLSKEMDKNFANIKARESNFGKLLTSSSSVQNKLNSLLKNLDRLAKLSESLRLEIQKKFGNYR